MDIETTALKEQYALVEAAFDSVENAKSRFDEAEQYAHENRESDAEHSKKQGDEGIAEAEAAVSNAVTVIERIEAEILKLQERVDLLDEEVSDLQVSSEVVQESINEIEYEE